jgi:hypothetical protein
MHHLKYKYFNKNQKVKSECNAMPLSSTLTPSLAKRSAAGLHRLGLAFGWLLSPPPSLGAAAKATDWLGSCRANHQCPPSTADSTIMRQLPTADRWMGVRELSKKMSSNGTVPIGKSSAIGIGGRGENICAQH